MGRPAQVMNVVGSSRLDEDNYWGHESADPGHHLRNSSIVPMQNKQQQAGNHKTEHTAASPTIEHLKSSMSSQR